MPCTTWVLGSGFSRPLGGPLLADLFSETSTDRWKYFFQATDFPKLFDGHAECVLGLYRNSMVAKEAKPWKDPEDFLDKLDSAALSGPDSPSWKSFLSTLAKYYRYSPYDFRKLGATARRLLAAECSAFLLENTPELAVERWMPYLNWVKFLDENDVIITFNYDTVLEQLRDLGSKLHIQLPGDREKHRDLTRVLKLHGSVDWRQTPSGVVSADRLFALNAETDELAIAAPGPSKRSSVSSWKDLWDLAAYHLEHCDSIVFIGYRFPDTDTEATFRLLQAISTVSAARCIPIRTVLGPAVDAVDSKRLLELLRLATGGTASVKPLCLYSQDLLSLYRGRDFLENT